MRPVLTSSKENCEGSGQSSNCLSLKWKYFTTAIVEIDSLLVSLGVNIIGLLMLISDRNGQSLVSDGKGWKVDARAVELNSSFLAKGLLAHTNSIVSNE